MSGILHVRICGGAGRQLSALPGTRAGALDRLEQKSVWQVPHKKAYGLYQILYFYFILFQTTVGGLGGVGGSAN